MPTITQLQVRMLATSNKTEDDLTNTWHFQVMTLPPPAATLAAIRDAVKAFYNTTNAYCVGDWGLTFTYKFYDLSDPMPRAPITTYSVVQTGFGSTTSSIPRQNALVLSYKASQISGQDMKRRRGRLYLPPPINTSMLNDGRIAATVVDGISGAANTLLTASTAAADWEWVVYSHVAATSAPVVSVWCDNKCDTQRRRGQDASYRKVLP